MTFQYNPNIPNGPNSPSADQPLMQNNFNSINSILGVDHYSFGQTGPLNQGNIDGRHKQVSLVNETSPAIPLGVNAILYSKSVTNSLGTIDTIIAKVFGQESSLFGITNVPGGYVSLYGGLILQFGNFNPNVSINVSFPKNFPTAVLSIQLTGSASNNSTYRAAISTGSLSNSGFTFQGTIDSHWTPIYYLAIGY